MRLRGSSSWRLETRDSQFLHVALYVREGAGIQIPADEGAPPRLRQATPPDAADPRDGARVPSEQWWDWWQSLVAFEVGAFEMTRGWQDSGDPPRLRALADAASAAFDPPDFDTIAGLPELRAVVSRRWREALDWFAGRSAAASPLPPWSSGDFPRGHRACRIECRGRTSGGPRSARRRRRPARRLRPVGTRCRARLRVVLDRAGSRRGSGRARGPQGISVGTRRPGEVLVRAAWISSKADRGAHQAAWHEYPLGYIVRT